jgi:hypothetical protein
VSGRLGEQLVLGAEIQRTIIANEASKRGLDGLLRSGAAVIASA